MGHHPKRQVSQGRTIVLTTHYMEEAERLCDDIAIMDKGRVIARGGPIELIRTHCRRATVSLPKPLLPESINRVDDHVRIRGDRVQIRTEAVNDVVARLLQAGVDLGQVDVRTPTLEDVFLKLTGRSLRD